MVTERETLMARYHAACKAQVLAERELEAATTEYEAADRAWCEYCYHARVWGHREPEHDQKAQ
jgi:hypothetical protein